MLKRKVTYTDFNGDPQTEELYFNLSKTELLVLETVEDLGTTLTNLVKAENIGGLITEVKKLVLLSYGVKSADGKSFTKVDATGRRLAEDFIQTAAFDALFMEFVSSAEACALFIKGVIPTDVVLEVERTMALQTEPKPISSMPPPPPFPPAA